MTKAHWNAIYEQRSTEELPWHEPLTSTLGLVTANSTTASSMIDIGGGASLLVGELLDLGYDDLTVLDISPVGLEQSRQRLGFGAARVDWIHADVTGFEPGRTWDLWHDRAVFHFLVDREGRDAYRSVAARAVAPGGVLVVSTFGLDGPEYCAGLPVCRYDGDTLAGEFSLDFELVDAGPVAPGSDDGDQRPYVAVLMRRLVDA